MSTLHLSFGIHIKSLPWSDRNYFQFVRRDRRNTASSHSLVLADA